MYSLDSIDLADYGIIPSHSPSSNIALVGNFDMPERDGELFYSWDDESGIDPYTDEEDIFFKGRDIKFYGNIFGKRESINTKIALLSKQINEITDLVVFSTPYGDYNVYVKNISTSSYYGAASIIMTLREPVVDLTGGSLPSTASAQNTIDNIPLESFGLYLSNITNLYNLGEPKKQYFTKYGEEGYQISKHKENEFNFEAVLISSSLEDLQSKISNLNLLFSSSGLRKVKFNALFVSCFAANGFTISNINYTNSQIVCRFKIKLIISSVYFSVFITENSGNKILTTEDGKIIVYG